MSERKGAIDYWCNLFTPEGLRRLYVEPPEFAWPAKAWSMSGRLAGRSVAQFLAMMDANGFASVGIPATKVYNWSQRHLIWDLSVADIAPIVDAHPDRFFGLYGIDPATRMAEPIRTAPRSVRRSPRRDPFRPFRRRSRGCQSRACISRRLRRRSWRATA